MKKNILRESLLLSLMVVLLLCGCQKQPTEEITAAKASIDAAVSEGAQKFAADDLKKINDDMQAADQEIKAQDGKVFKDYKKAKELLAKVKADAESLKAALPEKKKEIKKKAEEAYEAAQATKNDAAALLAKAPRGKDSAADLGALKGDLKGVEDSLAEIKKSMESEDYQVVVEKSNAAKEKASAISGQIREALEKAGSIKKKQ